MAADLNFGMDKAELKQLLAKSKKEPLGCAFGKGKDAKTAYLRLDKIKPGKKIEAELSKDFPDMKDGRWGTAQVDTDIDPKLVTFLMNKPAAGIGKRLIKILKLAGYTKLRFEYEDGSPPEEERDEEDEGLEAGSESEEMPPADSLKPRLTALVQRIPAALQLDPTRKAQFMELAKQGQGLIAANDYAGALHAIEDLEVALDAPVIKKEPISANTGAVAYGKSRLAWLAVHGQMVASVAKLRASIKDTYGDSPAWSKIDSSFSERIENKLEALDESLADLLDDAMNATDAEKRAAKVQLARDKIVEYKNFLSSEKALLEDIDSNPFVEVSILPTLTKTLDTLSAAVR
jgi:hypothetical protein